MKQACLFFVIVLSALKVEAMSSNDSIYIKGLVRPEEAKYPFKVLKHVSVSVLKNDTVIQRTFSDQNGCFQLKCSKKDLKNNLRILAEARSSQPVVTYDSICPYRVFKTSDGYFDKYVNLSDTQVFKDTIQLDIKMSAPLNMSTTCMRFNLKGNCQSEEPCLSQHPDTMCICVANSFNRINKHDIELVLTLRSYYTDHADSAQLRAEQMADLFQNKYSINRKSIKIEVYNSNENNGKEVSSSANCNYILVSFIGYNKAPKKDH